MAPKDKPFPPGDAPGMMVDGTINIGTPEEMRPKMELWKRQQEALERGEDPTLITLESLESDDDLDASDLHDYDDLLEEHQDGDRTRRVGLPQMQHAYYSSSIPEFLARQPQTALGFLAQRHGHDIDPLQRNAWLDQITILQRELGHLSEGWIAFEFAIPRMGKRVDNILILSGIIFVIEFKVGSARYELSAIDQATDYVLDLKNFHFGSHHRRIVPIVVATEALEAEFNLHWNADGVAKAVLCNGSNLGALLSRIVQLVPNQPQLDPKKWCACRKSNPDILMMQPAQDRTAKNVTHDLNRWDGKQRIW